MARTANFSPAVLYFQYIFFPFPVACQVNCDHSSDPAQPLVSLL